MNNLTRCGWQVSYHSRSMFLKIKHWDMSFTFDRIPSTNVMHITEWQKHTSELTQQCWRAKALHGVKETGKDYSSNHVRENTWKCSVLETIFTSAKNNDWNNLSSLLQKLWFCQLPYFTISCRGKKYWLMSFHSYNYTHEMCTWNVHISCVTKKEKV